MNLPITLPFIYLFIYLFFFLKDPRRFLRTKIEIMRKMIFQSVTQVAWRKIFEYS